MNLEIYISDFLTLIFAHFIALISPGVDFFIIVSTSSKYGKLSGILTACGIAIANLIYILLALFGIALIKDNDLLFIVIKTIGSIYLLYIGFALINTSKRDLFSYGKNNQHQTTSKRNLIKYFSLGFLSAILNPKNSIFYFTMFSISIQNYTPFKVQSFYALWMFLAVLVWDIFIVYLVSNKKSKIFLQKYSNSIEKISGIILILISILIIINILLN